MNFLNYLFIVTPKQYVYTSYEKDTQNHSKTTKLIFNNMDTVDPKTGYQTRDHNSVKS